MIFKWQDKFSENQILEGIDLIDDITEMDRTINTLSGTVNENGEEYWVDIELNEDFTVKSLYCSCKKSRCRHMAALLQSDMEYFNKDMNCSLFVEDIDNDKIMEFIKKQLIVNWECHKDFIEEFRLEMLQNEKLEIEDKLCLILRYPKRDDLLIDFVKNDLTELYEEEEYVEVFYLIISMFPTVIKDISHYGDSKLWPCWSVIEDLIVKLSRVEPELVGDFIYDCREECYGIYYPEFAKLISKLKFLV